MNNSQETTGSSLLKIVTLSKQGLTQLVENDYQHSLILVVFTTEWCGACKRMLKVFKQLIAEKAGILVLQVDAEKSEKLSRDQDFRVSIIPRTFVFQERVFWKDIEGSVDFVTLKKTLHLE